MDEPAETLELTEDRRGIYKLAYEEGTRTLEEQAVAREQVRLRAVGVLTTATAATAFLAGVVAKAARSDQDSIYWLGVAFGSLSYVVLLLITGSVLTPKGRRWRLNLSPDRLVSDYAEAEPPATLAETHRNLALHYSTNIGHNQELLDRLQARFVLALWLMPAELVIWGALTWRVA